MFQIFEEMSDLIYIIDMDTYELLYMNQSGKDSFHVSEVKGKKCYKLLQGKEEPCEFCTNKYLKEGEFYTWTRKNPKIDRYYILKDGLVDWNGKKARIEIAFDITEKAQQEEILWNELAVGNLVTDCAKKLYNMEDLDSVLSDVLQMIGNYLKASRVYLFQIENSRMSNTHEWCQTGTVSEIDSFQDMPISFLGRWLEEFKVGKPIIIENLNKIRDTYAEEYQMLEDLNIQSLIIAPLTWEGECIGFVGVNNFSVPLYGSTVLLLTSVSYFISAALYQQWALLKLEKLSFYDSLTNLMNRNRYIQDLEKEIIFPVGGIFIDVNGTKQMNDTFGHQYGDEILCDVAKNILQCFPHDSCYRVGGDEFVVLCQDIDQTEFQVKVQELKYIFQSKDRYSIAMGSRWEENPQDIQNLLYYADEKMYLDKQRFYRGNRLTERYRFRLDDILGLSAPGVLLDMIDAGNFIVYYQPKFSIQNNAITGAEALVRCKVKENIVYTPNRFVPILEETGLISVLDFYVFENVCCQLERWVRMGKEIVPISVNFSRKSLEEENFVERLESITSKYDIPTDLLEIEITETAEADDRNLLQDITSLLRDRHFPISIDDFGVRNANLSLFVDLEFDVLKIDRHVTEQLCQNRKSQLLISALVQICHKMEVKLIVEGIETKNQLDILREIKCEEGQGYIFSRPLPLMEFERFLSN